MKAICYILSIYLLSLAGMPCADSLSGNTPESDAVSVSVNAGDGEHGHNKADDDCSTLCACQCCRAPVHAVFPAALNPIGSISFTHIKYTRHFSAAVIARFLRPPIA